MTDNPDKDSVNQVDEDRDPAFIIAPNFLNIWTILGILLLLFCFVAGKLAIIPFGIAIFCFAVSSILRELRVLNFMKVQKYKKKYSLKFSRETKWDATPDFLLLVIATIIIVIVAFLCILSI